MKKALTYVAGAAVAAMVGMAATPSNAALIDANGTFGFTTFLGTVTLNTADIEAGTTQKSITDLVINTIDPTFMGQPNNLGLGGVVGGAPVTFTSFPITILSGPAGFDVNVGSLTFTFTDAFLKNLTPLGAASSGVFGTQYDGTLTGDTTNTFNLGTPAVLAENCNQSQIGAIINCSDTLSIAPGLIPEPGSLALLGSALAGFGLYRRRRNQASA